MRPGSVRSLTLAVTLACAAACGGKGGATSGGSTPAAAPAPAPLVPGTTAFPGLDWGADAAAVTAAFPTATGSGDTLSGHGEHEGLPATIRFALDASGLVGIVVAYDAAFPAMEVCAETFAAVRARLDARLGPSSVDNLAAYWTTEASDVSLSCDPVDDDNRAELHLSYVPIDAAP